MFFREAIEKFMTWQQFNGRRKSSRNTYLINIRQFALYMRNSPIESVGLDDILNYLKDMEMLGFDQNNYMVKCMSLKKFFEFYHKQGITKIAPDLIPIPEGNYKFPKIAKVEDYNKVVDHIPATNDPRHIRNKCMLMMYRATGMRLNECIGLNITQIDLDRKVSVEVEPGVITTLYYTVLETEKSKKPHPIRQVFWDEPTNDQLRLWIKKREHLLKQMPHADKEALFISVTGVKAGRRITDNGVTQMLSRYSHEAGLDTVLNSHSLRHLFGREAGDNNVPIERISDMLGHAHIESSRPYVMMNPERMAQVYAKKNANIKN